MIYVGTDSDVYEQILSPNAAYWSSAQLVAGGQIASLSSALTSIVDSLGEHVFYENSGHIVHLFRSVTSSTWTAEDMTALATTPTSTPVPAVSGSALAAFSDSSGIHVFYIGTNEHVCRYQSSTPGTWTNKDLSHAANTTTTAASSGLAALSDSNGEHVFYLGTGSDVHWLNLASASGSKWADTDLSATVNNATVAKSGTGLAAFVESSGVEHVFYIEKNTLDVSRFQSSTSGTNWTYKDLSALFPNEATRAGNALAAYLDTPTPTIPSGEQVFYIDIGLGINEFNYVNGWSYQDLSPDSSGATHAVTGSGLTALENTGDSTDHVFYVAFDQHIHQFYRSPIGGGWQNQDVSTTTAP